jgi:hypothetical protein
MTWLAILLALSALTLPLCVSAAEPAAPATPPKPDQNPSPMVEHTRAHARLQRRDPPGTRHQLKLGTLFLPDRLPPNAPLVLHLHGGTWIPEIAAARHNVAVISLQLGSGSATYAKPFTDPAAFPALLDEAEEESARRFDAVGLCAWSAGYGAVREILKTPANDGGVAFVLLLDGLHCG